LLPTNHLLDISITDEDYAKLSDNEKRFRLYFPYLQQQLTNETNATTTTAGIGGANPNKRHAKEKVESMATEKEGGDESGGGNVMDLDGPGAISADQSLLLSYGKLRGGHTFHTLPFAHRAVLSSSTTTSATSTITPSLPSTPKAGLRDSSGFGQQGLSETVESFRHLCSQELAQLQPTIASNAANSSQASANVNVSNNSNAPSLTSSAGSAGGQNGALPSAIGHAYQTLVLPKTVERTLHGYNMQVDCLFVLFCFVVVWFGLYVYMFVCMFVCLFVCVVVVVVVVVVVAVVVVVVVADDDDDELIMMLLLFAFDLMFTDQVRALEAAANTASSFPPTPALSMSYSHLYCIFFFLFFVRYVIYCILLFLGFLYSSLTC
jgi:hypothetical protein